MNEPTHLDLFSGIGGFALAAQWAGFRTIGFCEIDRYCQKVLTKNFLADAESGGQQWGFNGLESDDQREGANGAPIGQGLQRPIVSRSKIHGNIFDLDGRQFAGVSLVTGGFPCQPFSVAGKRRGAADYRHLWPEMLRVINEARPAWVLGENVPGIIPMELDNVLSDLERIGYACRPFVIPACAVDARHRRDRLWVVGRLLANGSGEQGATGNNRRESRLFSESRQIEFRGSDCWKMRECNWLPEPDVGRVAHGIPSRVDRLKGLGNAIVPQVAYEILKEIRKLIDVTVTNP